MLAGGVYSFEEINSQCASYLKCLVCHSSSYFDYVVVSTKRKINPRGRR